MFDDDHNKIFRRKWLIDVNEFVAGVQWKCLEVHRIKLSEVAGELTWLEVLRLIIEVLDEVIAEHQFTAGVLVSFNGNTCDNPIFAVELLRVHLVLPAIFIYTLVLEVQAPRCNCRRAARPKNERQAVLEASERRVLGAEAL